MLTVSIVSTLKLLLTELDAWYALCHHPPTPPSTLHAVRPIVCLIQCWAMCVQELEAEAARQRLMEGRLARKREEEAARLRAEAEAEAARRQVRSCGGVGALLLLARARPRVACVL